MGARLSPKVPPPNSLWRENIPLLPAPRDNSVHSPQCQLQPFGFFPLCRRKRAGGGGEKAPLGRFLLQCKDEERLHELLLRWSTPCSLDDCWSKEYQARLVFLLLPSSLFHPPELICSRGEWARAGTPLGLLSCLIPLWLSLQLGLGASDLHPSSPKPGSSTKPSPRRQRRGIPRMLRSIWSVLCSVCPPGDVQPDLGRVAALPLPPPSLL